MSFEELYSDKTNLTKYEALLREFYTNKEPAVNILKVQLGVI